MRISGPFQRLFSTQNTIENPRIQNSPISTRSCEGSTPPEFPDPTPATTKIGSGVRKPGRRELYNPVFLSAGVRVLLTERDKGILRLCYEQQFLLRDHLEPFFEGCSIRRINFRLQQLIDGGYLRREHYPELGLQSIYRLTSVGIKLTQDLNPRTRRYLSKINSTTLFHDALVTSCRLKFSKIWTAQFHPERELKESEFPEIVDGLWRFQSGKFVALEVECSDKGRKRFLRRLHNLGRIESITLILYVVPNERMLSIVRTYLKDSPSEQPSGVCLWGDISAGLFVIQTNRGPVDLSTVREW